MGNMFKLKWASVSFVLKSGKWHEIQGLPWVSLWDWGLIPMLGSHRSQWLISVIEALATDGQANKSPGKVIC